MGSKDGWRGHKQESQKEQEVEQKTMSKKPGRTKGQKLPD